MDRHGSYSVDYVDPATGDVVHRHKVSRQTVEEQIEAYRAAEAAGAAPALPAPRTAPPPTARAAPLPSGRYTEVVLGLALFLRRLPFGARRDLPAGALPVDCDECSRFGAVRRRASNEAEC